MMPRHQGPIAARFILDACAPTNTLPEILWPFGRPLTQPIARHR